MRITKFIPVMLLAVGLSSYCLAADADAKTEKPKEDKLATCPVSGDKLGEMGKPFVFIYKDQEVKLCCKSCKKDFDKDPAKYMKKIREADKDPDAKGVKN
jgi:hypothetical protein